MKWLVCFTDLINKITNSTKCWKINSEGNWFIRDKWNKKCQQPLINLLRSLRWSTYFLNLAQFLAKVHLIKFFCISFSFYWFFVTDINVVIQKRNACEKNFNDIRFNWSYMLFLFAIHFFCLKNINKRFQ